MQAKGARADALIDAPGHELAAILIHGTDGGLVRARARRAVAALAGQPADGFLLAEIEAAELCADPARLADERAAIAMMGGRRVVHVTGAADAQAGAIAAALEGPGDALIVVEAGSLNARSKLRQLFDKPTDRLSIACYEGGEDLAGEARRVFAALGAQTALDAIEALAASIDRPAQIALEARKLADYADGEEITAAHVAALTGDPLEASSDAIVDAALDGDFARLDAHLATAYGAGAQPVAILRAAARRLAILHEVAGAAVGGDIRGAVKALRPPLFFRAADAVARQARNWPSPRAAAGLRLVIDCEIDCKRAGAPAATLCARALMRLAGLAAQARR